MFSGEFAALVHMPLPLLHMAAVVIIHSRETERPGVKRGQLRNDATYLILDLFGALDERGNIFLPDVIFDPVPRLRPMPSVTNALDSFLPIWLVAGLFQGLRELRKQGT